MLGFLIFSSVLVVSYQQCCFPSQWEGIGAGSMATVPTGSNVPLYTAFNYLISVDHTKHLLVLSGDYVTHGDYVKMKTIIDYNAKIEYSMNYASNTCKKTVLTTNELSCLGKNGNNATIIDRTHFGAGGQQIPVEIYSGLVGGYPSYFSVSEGCIPVGITYHGMDANGNGVIGSIGYHDITSGVSDTSVFDLPAKCISAPLENIVVG